QQFFRLGEIIGAFAQRVEAEIFQRGGHDFGRRVEQGDAAIGEIGGDLGIEDQVPAVDRRIFHALGNGVDVVADAGGAPHVNNGVLIVRVGSCDRGHDILVHVGQVGQLGLVELC